MKKEDVLKDIAYRLKTILSHYQKDQPIEGLKQLTELFIDLSVSYAFCLPKEKQQQFIVELCTSIMADMVRLIRDTEKDQEVKPKTIQMNAEYKS